LIALIRLSAASTKLDRSSSESGSAPITFRVLEIVLAKLSAPSGDNVDASSARVLTESNTCLTSSFLTDFAYNSRLIARFTFILSLASYYSFVSSQFRP
jgi:hypothetical protein